MAETVLQDVYTLQIRRQNSVSNPSPYCEACKNGFVHVNSIQVRQFTQTGKLPGVCRSCNDAFLKICRLQIRHLTQTSSVHHVCPKCNKTFSHAGNFKKHLLLHDKEDDVPPSEKECSSSKKVNRPDPPYECRLCGKIFVKYGSFLKHVNNHELEAKTEESSSEVGKNTESETGGDIIYNNQEQPTSTSATNHQSPKLFNCTYCPEYFAKKGFLLRHIQMQHEAESYQCQVCKKEFKTMPILSSHMRTHKHICKLCKEAFADVYDLENHLQQHVHEQTEAVVSRKKKTIHYCSVCQKGYFHLGHLRKHYLAHTNDAFPQPSEPQSNEYFEMKEPPKRGRPRGKPRYSFCEICKRRYKFARTLKRHMNTHHENQQSINLPDTM